MTGADELLTIEEAADVFGRNPAALRKAAQRGRLAATKKGTQWLTTAGDVARYTAEVEAWRAPGRVGNRRKPLPLPRSQRLSRREVAELVP